MFTRLCVPLTLAIALAGTTDSGRAQGGAGDKELAKLAGTWVAREVIIDGKKRDASKPTTTLVIKGNDLTWTHSQRIRGGGKSSSITFSLTSDATRTPKRLKLTATEGFFRGKAFLTIYHLEGKTLKLCRAQPGKGWPKDFSCPKGSDHWLLVLERR
jgi:uncharacterized protein (TIGR03067 family)